VFAPRGQGAELVGAMGLTLLVGGAASGKSSFAVRMAKSWKGPVVFIATGQPLDEEMSEKIDRHRSFRPLGWTTVEEPLDLESSLSGTPPDAFVILDCLTLWLSNLMQLELSDDEIETRSDKAASIASDRSAPTVVVTNEVGSGIVPANHMARRYRNLLGRMNSRWAEMAETSLFLVAGRAISLHNPETFVDSTDG
jgi:adenosylcobinamide kinase/adenosylcobinamide-phosphate guanylyltransferase